MPRPDTANFNRFLTSVGLLLIAVSLLGPYFYFRNTDLLRISEKEMRTLTRTGRSAIRRRQNTVVALERPILILAAAGLLAGSLFLFNGGRRLRRLQGKEDEAIEREATLVDFKIKQLSEDEKDERRDEQAREAVKRPDAPPQFDFQKSRRAVDRTEDRLDASLQREDFEAFEYLSDVKVVGGHREGEIAIDGLFKSRDRDRPDVLLEMKLMVSDPTPLLAHFADAVLALLSRYHHLTGHDALGWLVIVLSEEAGPSPQTNREDLEAWLETALAGLGHATVLCEDELSSAPERFRALFSPPAEGPLSPAD